MKPVAVPQRLVPERAGAVDATDSGTADETLAVHALEITCGLRRAERLDPAPHPHNNPMVNVRRAALVVASAATFALALAVQLRSGGGLADLAAHALGGVLVYLLVALIRVRSRPWIVAAVAAGFGVVIELFQLTDIPVALVGITPLTDSVFATTFSPTDLIVLVSAIVAVATIDTAVRRHLE
jgi:hypothetical protein